MEANDSAVEMCTLLSMKNSRAFSISSQSTQAAWGTRGPEVVPGDIRQPVRQGAPAVET